MKIIQVAKSRTVWTIVAMFVIGGTNAVASYIPSGVEPIVMGVLSLLAVYFKLSPSQNYNQ